MTDTQLLTERIKASGLKLNFIAQKMGITRQSLSNKIYNRRLFNAAEIKALCDILSIASAKEKEKIFFKE